MRRTSLAAVVLSLLVAGILMSLDRRRLARELESVKAALAAQAKELDTIRAQEGPRTEPPVQARVVPAPVTPIEVPQSPRLSIVFPEALNQLIRMRDEIEAVVVAAEAKVFALARDVGVTVEDLDQRNAPPERLEPFFTAVHDWKNQIRIAETIERRIKAEMVDVGP